VDLAFQLAAALAGRGVEILSGLARGIDAAAHRGALSATGRTGAVLGTSLDGCYPPEHQRLQESIASSVGLLTELPSGAPPTPSSFASRNRLLAALSDAVVVVEGTATSGALLTARHARTMDRPIGALPWSLWCERGAAPHRLLHDGHATLVRNPEDVLALLPGGGAWPPAELPLGIDTRVSSDSSRRARRARAKRPWVTAALPSDNTHVPGSLEARVLAALEERPQTPDEITLRAGASFRETSSVLLRFEMEGLVRREFGGRVRLQPKLRFSRTERS
jgi:DNA processing protein